MKFYEYVLKLKDQATPALTQLKKMAGSFGDEAVRTTRKLAGMNNEVGRMPSLFTSAKSAIVGFVSLAAVVGFGNQMVQATARMDGYANSIKFSSGSAIEAAKNTQFLNSWIDQVGLNAESSFKSFQLLNGGLMGFQNQGQLARDVFKGVSMAAAAFNLPAEQAEGAILAISQIAGKGKVSMEELRGQLGERIPGAMQIAARAMGVTTAQFEGMVAAGIPAQQFLPKFAAELQKTFGGAMPQASQSLTANINRLQNAIFRAFTTLGTQLKPAINATVILLGKMISFVSRNSDLIFTLVKWVGIAAVVYGVYYGAMAAGTIIQNLFTASLIRGRIATTAYSVGMWLLNAAMMANPVGFFILLFVALAGAFLYAFNKSEKLRGGIVGLWEGFKTLMNNITNIFMPVLQNLMNAFDALTEGRWKDAVKFGAKAALELQLMPAKMIGAAFSGELTKGVSDAFKKGDAAGRKMAPIGLATFGLGGIMGDGLGLNGSGNNSSENTDNKPQGMGDVTGGGSKPLTVNISFRNFIEDLKIESASTAEAFDQTERRLQDMFGRLIDGAVSSTGR